LNTLALAMRFAEHVAEKESVDKEWSRALYECFERHAAAADGSEATRTKQERDAAVVALYSEVFKGFTRLNARIANDLSTLRASWVSAAPLPGNKRLEVFDRCVASRLVRVLSAKGRKRKLQQCEFSGVVSTDTQLYRFGHAPTDLAPTLTARVDRQCFYYVVRPILAYAHFASHMATHKHAYPGLSDKERLRTYARELQELRAAVMALVKVRPSVLESEAFKH
jgi:hypothetical protein